MKNRMFFIIIGISLYLGSCEKKIEFERIEYIKVDIKNKYPKGDFDDYFSSSRIISLETNEHSIFHRIDRLSLVGSKIFILDRKSNGVFIFNSKGEFINKIQEVGRGPGEYISLTDFTIDKEKGHIILYSDRPYKVLTYKMDGQFVKEEIINDYYSNIGYLNDNLLCLSKGSYNNKMLVEYNLNSRSKNGLLEMNVRDHIFESLGINSPEIIKSDNLNLCLPYSEIIYTYDEKEISPKYKIDFGENNITNDFIDKYKKKKYNRIFYDVVDNNYGFGTSNFRENKNYVTFNFWGNMITIYSKKSRKTESFSFFYHEENKISFSHYFAHDGDDNKLISVCSAENFKIQMDYHKEFPEIWDKLPNHLKEMNKEVSDSNNPLLIIYTFKG